MTEIQLPQAYDVADYEALARGRLSAADWAYLAGGAGDELTLRWNREAHDRRRLVPQVLGDMANATTRTHLLGLTLEHPILLAPVAYHRLFHPDGEAASAMGAGVVKAPLVVSTQASMALEEIRSATHGHLWFQLYIQHDWGFTANLVARAEAAGYGALVVTVDAPVSLRNGERRAGFALPPGIDAVNLRGLPPAPLPQGGGIGDGPLFGTARPATAIWHDIASLRAMTKLPLLLKGILSPLDALRALEEGVDGLIVSNHGGRVLDGVVASLDALPGVVAAVNGKVPVLVDGGIRRGTDILRAVALGASAVLVGRPYIYGLATAGAAGVAHVVHLLRAELEVAMALTGRPTLEAVAQGGLFEG